MRSAIVPSAVVWLMAVGLAEGQQAGRAQQAQQPQQAQQGQQAQRLEYRTSGQPDRGLGTARGRLLATQTEAPKGLKLPKFADKTPLFVKWDAPMAPGGQVWLALDRSKEGGLPDLLYVDGKCTGSLADEPPVKGRRFQMIFLTRGLADQQRVRFELVKVLLPGEGAPTPYHLNLEVIRQGVRGIPQGAGTVLLNGAEVIGQGGQDTLSVHASAAGWYEGRVSIGGKRYLCKLADWNVNGTFDDVSLDIDQADRIIIDDGRWPQERPVGRYLQMADRLYALTVARNGGRVTVAPAGDVPMGVVAVGTGITEVSFGGDSGLLFPAMTEGKAMLPLGRYRPNAWKINRKDEQGRLWVASSGEFPGDCQFEVRRDRPAEVKLGEPFTAGLVHSFRNGEHTLSRTLSGASGERVSLRLSEDRSAEAAQSRPFVLEISVRVNATRPPAPSLGIRSADGSYDQTFPMQYG